MSQELRPFLEIVSDLRKTQEKLDKWTAKMEWALKRVSELRHKERALLEEKRNFEDATFASVVKHAQEGDG